MLHLLLTHLARQPELFAEHASAYASLAALEARDAGRSWRRRALAWAACVTAGLLGLVFACVAGLLAAALPWSAMPAPWVLVALPAAWWMCSWVAWRVASRPSRLPGFVHLRQQWALDTQLMRDLTRPT